VKDQTQWEAEQEDDGQADDQPDDRGYLVVGMVICALSGFFVGFIVRGLI
jgi:hypothetical protein